MSRIPQPSFEVHLRLLAVMYEGLIFLKVLNYNMQFEFMYFKAASPMVGLTNPHI